MRFNYLKDNPESVKGMREIENYVRSSKLPAEIHELVKLRASQINGCAFCLNMHSHDALKLGMDPQKIYTLAAWREAQFYTDKERAALEWTEALTLISEHKTTDELYERVKKHFDNDEFMALTMAIIAINSWNRLAISSGKEPTNYNTK